jgi:hypothetical protein
VSEGKSQVFSGISPAQYAKLVEKAHAAGFEIDGNSGSAKKMGVEVAWHYSELDQKLELTCVHAPFFVSADEVDAKLREMVSQALAS